MTPYIRLERTAQLSLLAMTTCNSTDTSSIYFIPLCPCHGLLHHMYLDYDISLRKMCGSSLKSNKMYYLLFSKGAGILEGPELLPAPCGMCSEYHR